MSTQQELGGQRRMASWMNSLKSGLQAVKNSFVSVADSLGNSFANALGRSLYWEVGGLRDWFVAEPIDDLERQTARGGVVANAWVNGPAAWRQNIFAKLSKVFYLLPDQPRGYRWLISTAHVPTNYRELGMRTEAPWTVLARFFMTDIFACLDEFSSKEMHRWRWMPVPSLNRISAVPRSASNNFRRYLRRCVFTPLERVGRMPPGQRLGKWLVVVYINSDDRHWLETVDPTELVGLGNMTSTHAYRFASSHDGASTKWQPFYRAEFDEPNPDDQYTMYDGPVLVGQDPPRVPTDFLNGQAYVENVGVLGWQVRENIGRIVRSPLRSDFPARSSA